MSTPRPSRRIVFQGLGALGVAAVLAGCGGDSDTSADDETTPADPSTTPEPSDTGSASSQPSSAGVPGALADTSEVPLGGGLILGEERIVITQPTAGEFVAFSAICKHQGFTVTSVADNVISCSHHGSKYDAATGEVVSPPAPVGLDELAIKVQGTTIVRA